MNKMDKDKKLKMSTVFHPHTFTYTEFCQVFAVLAGCIGFLILFLASAANFLENNMFIPWWAFLLSILIVSEVIFIFFFKGNPKKGEEFWHTFGFKLLFIVCSFMGLTIIGSLIIWSNPAFAWIVINNEGIFDALIKLSMIIGFLALTLGLFCGLVKLNTLKYKKRRVKKK